MELNKYQKEAIEHLDGPCLVTSCPGSGKTTTLTERVVRLIERGVTPKNILCLTFTNKAANEMKQRISKRLGIKQLGFFIGTFHSMCASVLRNIREKRGDFSTFNILDDKDQLDLILKISRGMEVDLQKGDAYRVAYALNHYRDRMESMGWLSSNLQNSVFVDIAMEYFEVCKRNNLIDFSGLIYNTIEVLEEDEEMRGRLQNTFKYILVDEGQDTNTSQYYLISILGDKWKNVMLIADVDQSIYKFRHARYQNVQEFVSSHQNCRTITLSKNYRSTPQIISVADKLIRHNNDRVKIKFETDNPNGEPVMCYDIENQIKEAEWVAKRIKRLKYEGGWGLDDICVLYRVNKMSEALEQAFTSNGIPYEVIGGLDFYSRKEAKDCIAMLKFLVNRRDNIAFHRICSIIKGLGNITVGKIENIAVEKDIDLLEACREFISGTNSVKAKNACQSICDIYDLEYDLSQPYSCLKLLVSEFDFEQHLLNKFGEKAEDRIENVNQLTDAASAFNNQKRGVDRYLQQISLLTSNDKEADGKKVSLMTLHGAKGLEFPIVFMIGVEQNILPHGRAISESYDNICEERRLAYVGMTRAKKILYITWCRNRVKYNKYGNLFPIKSMCSQFLKEAGLVGDEVDSM
jgi:DNA helicase II / ATP-dependent DNA helicase PcrA